MKKSSPEDQLTQISDDIQKFYRYLSVGGKLLSPIWSSPYIDYFSGQELMSVAIPVYYIEDSTNMETIFGVVGLDVLTNQF